MTPIKTTLLAASFLFFSLGAPRSVEAAEKPEDILLKWEKFFIERKLLSILDLYSKNAVLTPTFGSTCLTDKKDFATYFERLFSKDDLVVTFDDLKIVKSLPGGGAIIDGSYTFSFHDDETNAMTSIPARYTYVLTLVNDRFKIIAHHSSVKPEANFA